MKKLTAIAILSGSFLGVHAAQAQDLSLSTTFGFESKYVFRGVQLADESFMPAIDLSYGGFYAGIWSALPFTGSADAGTQNSGFNADEIDLYAGYGFGVTEMISLDVGFTYYMYPEYMDDLFDTKDLNDDTIGSDDDGVNTFEPFVGVAFDTILQPSIYVYYDINLENLTLEGSIGHSFEVSESSAIELSGSLGWVNISADQNNIGGEDSYWYTGASADYVYSFTEYASISLGGRASWASEDVTGNAEDKRDGDLDDFAFWYGFAFTAGF